MQKYILTILLLFSSMALSARQSFSLNDNWHFFYKMETSSDYARRVSLPHTWNLDALGGQGRYFQTIANYSRQLSIPAEWNGKRLFLKFHGVQSVADVFINGHHAGEHRGGWTAFTFEITKWVKFGENNSLVVVVNNAYQNDVLPTSTEMNLYGGIYREVELIVTEQTTISPLYYGSDGVLVRQDHVGDTSVAATALVWVTSTMDKTCDLAVTVRSPEGDAVYTRYLKGRIEPNTPIEIPFSIDEPLLWSPDDPNLYSVTIAIGPKQEDVVTVYTGFRRIEYTPTQIKINGIPQRIRGVTLHHDRAAIGNALRDRHYEEDLAIIEDMGANAIRSATAPHSQFLYDRCDSKGMMVWIDTPFTRAPYLSDVFYYATDKFRNNGLEQLREIIIQNYNHPSVIMWGIYSLAWLRGDNVLDFVKKLNSTAKELDPSRPTVACSNQDGDINFVSDLIVWQQDLGWTRGSFEDVDVWREKLHKDWSNLRSAIIYGEAGSIDQQSRDLKRPQIINTRWLPEGWQTDLHENYARRFEPDSLFWGVWINNMFEFGSVRTTDGIQRKGLVSFDRKDEKDAFFLYRSLWNKQKPTLHISEKRRDIRQDSMQSVKFYASTKETPVLVINRDTVKYKQVAPCQYISDAVPMHGRTHIELSAGDMRDIHHITIDNALVQRQ